ncbi:MAG TPA: hypothetical protein DD827_04490 [Gammaproteobacteria bacterium]|nr:hypothetical protein [Gammaproteobacteria bacterium]
MTHTIIQKPSHNSVPSSCTATNWGKSALLALALLLSSNFASADDTPSYDDYFKHYSQLYFGETLDWRLFKAQGMVESRLRKNAKSHRGARGIMQIMPATYREIQKKNHFYKTRELSSVDTNIGAGIFFDAYLYDRWNREVSAQDRIKLMLASYNGGYVRVLRAFNKAGKPENDWQAVAKYLPKETRNYVDRVLHLLNAEKAPKAQPSKSDQTRILASSED